MIETTTQIGMAGIGVQKLQLGISGTPDEPLIMGTQKRHFFGVISPIFWGVKPSCFMGTWGPKELCISCFSSFPTLFHPFSNISKQSG